LYGRKAGLSPAFLLQEGVAGGWLVSAADEGFALGRRMSSPPASAAALAL